MESLIESLTCDLNFNHGQNNNNNNNNNNNGAVTNGYFSKHLLDNPKYLPCCKRKACNKCILKCLTSGRRTSTLNDVLLSCPWCKKKTRVSISGDECNLESDDMAHIEYDKNLININQYLIRKLENNLKNVEDRFQYKENYLNKRKAYIEQEIHEQIELLKSHLDELEAELKENLEVSTKNMIINLDKIEKANATRIDELKMNIQNLKINCDSKSSKLNPNLNMALQHESVNTCIQNLNELNKLNYSINEMISELKFDPNPDLPEVSLVGNLKLVSDINLKEQFKSIKSQMFISRMFTMNGSNQPMPISPRYMTIADPYNLFFTDSQTKKLVHCKLDTGDVVRSTNLNGMLKNPDGICVNPIAAVIYVTDSETRQIFKLDYQFNVLKTFGYKDLKWPRGIYYDYESVYPNNTSILNPNRLYVCDPSNQFIAIYNDHEQLRDYLTISISDEPLPSYGKAITTQTFHTAGDKFRQNTIDEEVKFCPLNVFVNKTLIFVTDDWTGGNCIRIFDKANHRLLRNVGDLNAWNPLGLIVDDVGNIFTVARLYYETGATHLFCFNKDGDLIYKTNLNISNECVTDIVLDKFTDKINNRIICSGDKKIHYFQF